MDSVPFGDASIIAYLLSWGSHSLLNNPLSYYSPPIGYPFPYTLAGMDGMIFQSLLVHPAWFLFKNVPLVYNLSLYFSFLFAFLGGYVGCYLLLKSRSASFLAAVLFTITTDRFAHSNGHINLLFTGFLPLIFSLFYLLSQNGKNWILFGAGLSLGGSVYASNYTFVLSVITAGLALVCGFFVGGKSSIKNHFMKTIGALVLGGIVAFPIPLFHKFVMSDSNIIRSEGNLSSYSATWSGWFLPPNHQVLVSNYNILSKFPTVSHNHLENIQFLGYLVCIGFVLEVVRQLFLKSRSQYDRLSCALLICFIFLFLCSFGNNIQLRSFDVKGPYYLLSELFLKHTKFFRVPARLSFITQWLLALSLSISFYQLTRHKRKLSIFLLCPLVCVVWFEHVPQKVIGYNQTVNRAVFKKLDSSDPSGKEAFVILPDPQSLGDIAFSSTHNWRAMLNAWPDNPLLTNYVKKFMLLEQDPTSIQALEILLENNIRWVIAVKSDIRSKLNVSKFFQFEGDFNDGTSLFRIREFEETKSTILSSIAKRKELVKSFQNEAKHISLSPISNTLNAGGGLNTEVSQETSSLVLKPSTAQFASFNISIPQDFKPYLFKKLTVYYSLENPVKHKSCLYWGASNIALSERTRIDSDVESFEGKKYKVTFHLSDHPDWLWIDNLTHLRFDIFEPFDQGFGIVKVEKVDFEPITF